MNSQALVFMRAVADALDARPALAEVMVRTAHPGAKLPNEGIFLLAFSGDQIWAPFGQRRREETFNLAVSVYAERGGSGETAIRACQDRVFELAGEVETVLRQDPTVTGTIRVAAFRRPRFEQGFGDKGRWAELMFDIEAAVRI